ncbi:MAG: hypothetical protein A2Y25_01225 [Candidatus Melainabacteria bacterium GWF2_37_15]|nr:MAG: hypothetical protein A2Y25_01225 [Candidatus Melainabacteria bacterium GWF2_37_15]
MINWNVFLFFLYSFILFVLILETPNKIVHIREYPYIFGLVGFIGIYRYGMWLAHLIRAQIYERYFYKKVRKNADSIQEERWKPERLYFMIVSFLEEKEILSNSIKSIIQEARSLNLPVTICMGTASAHDEKIVSSVIGHDDKVKIIFVRQELPDKRLQIGRALRALVRQGVGKNDPVIFMDGDSVIYPGCLRKCLPVFHICPDVDALTTNEKAVVMNSWLLSNILSLRFAIRNFHMHSLALSRKVLCLTGRFSIFRGSRIIEESFISRIEYDYICDWYWEKIKFLSGDDKSTWYSLLERGSNMLYVPDAYIYSIEKVRSNPVKKYINDLQRWGGNMLRNNLRALQLGPRRTGFFTWFVLLDQRMSMWTAIFSPILIILMSFKSLKLTYMLILWVLLVRYLQSLLLFYYGGKINSTFPILLYFNQVLNGVIKIYMLFHLSLQRWNDQNIPATQSTTNQKIELLTAKYITILYIIIFFLIINAATS